MAIVESEFLAQVGDAIVHRRVFKPAVNHGAELKALRDKITRLRQDREGDLFDGELDEAQYPRRMRDYLVRRRELERLPVEPSGWSYQVTDRTYFEAWAESNEQERRALLRDAGVRLEILSIREWTVSIPDDMVARLQGNSLRQMSV